MTAEPPTGDSSAQLRVWVERMNAGDPAARDELIAHAGDRLRRLARRMFQDFPRVRRWEESGDVLQSALLRLLRALEAVKPQSVREFLRISAVQIRRELLDLARHHYGPQGPGAHHASVGDRPEGSSAAPGYDPPDSGAEPARLAQWAEFHREAEALPEEEREAVDLLWYQELTHDEAAAVLGVSASTVRRRWRSALLKLHRVLHDELPGA